MESRPIQLSVSKLIGLWAFSECALGGILHAFRFPFSGLLLAGFAVTVICCIGFSVTKPAPVILYGTLVAMGVKLALSPHTPVTAYFAVGFQGAMGALFFSFQRHSRLVYIVFGAVALVESALQKVLTMTIIFGNALWESLDVAAAQLVKSLGIEADIRYSLLILGTYSLLYLVWGGIVGYWAHGLPAKIGEVDRDAVLNYRTDDLVSQRPARRIKLLLWLCFGLILFTSIWVMRSSGHDILMLILRPLVVILVWWLLVNPLIRYLLTRFFSKQSSGFVHVINTIRAEIPQLRKLTSRVAAFVAENYTGVRQLRYFIIILILLACEEKSDMAG